MLLKPFEFWLVHVCGAIIGYTFKLLFCLTKRDIGVFAEKVRQIFIFGSPLDGGIDFRENMQIIVI